MGKKMRHAGLKEYDPEIYKVHASFMEDIFFGGGWKDEYEVEELPEGEAL